MRCKQLGRARGAKRSEPSPHLLENGRPWDRSLESLHTHPHRPPAHIPRRVPYALAVSQLANGLAAWDRSLRTGLARTNKWLERLCWVQSSRAQEFSFGRQRRTTDAGEVKETVRRLLLDTGAGASAYVLPSEVGAGISQVIPVVVAALEGRAGLSMIEQPEIHVHPRLQVGLGDLFIDAATRDGARRTILIETHSEHLMLRLLRRIEETHRGTLRPDDPQLRPEQLSVIFIEKRDGEARATRLRIDETGEFIDRWPQGFFEERANELF